MDKNEISSAVIDAAITVHTALGPGLLESAYEACLAHELRKRGMHVASQLGLPLIYDGMRIESGYRIDLLVEDAVIVELKTVDRLLPVHGAQVLTYLKLSGKPLGLLINFNAMRIKDGLKRFINGFLDAR